MKPRQVWRGRAEGGCLFVCSGFETQNLSNVFEMCQRRGTQHMHTGQGLHAERCLKDALCAYGRGLGRAQWWL